MFFLDLIIIFNLFKFIQESPIHIKHLSNLAKNVNKKNTARFIITYRYIVYIFYTEEL